MDKETLFHLADECSNIRIYINRSSGIMDVRYCLSAILDLVDKIRYAIYSTEEKRFSFYEIINLLKDGRKFRRFDWCSTHYISSSDNSIMSHTKTTMSPYHVCICDINAEDWIEVK